MPEDANQFYLSVNAALALRGLRIHSWAKAKGFPPGTVYKAAKGTRHGTQSRKIRAALEGLIK